METYTWKQATKEKNLENVIKSARTYGDYIIDKETEDETGFTRCSVIRVKPKSGLEYYAEFTQKNGEYIDLGITLDSYGCYSSL